MDINLVFKKIVEKLEASNRQDIIRYLQDRIGSASTGSEALMASAFYLSSLKDNNPLVYESIRELVKNM